MGNRTIRETTLLGDALRGIAELLPAAWTINHRRLGPGDDGQDGIVELTGQGGRVRFVVEAKRAGVVPSSVLMAVLREKQRQTGLRVLFVSDFIGLALRAALAAEGISYADATGWVRILSEDPLILLTGQGADRAPNRRASSAVTRLNGIAGSRLIRALPTVDLPIGVRRLASAADVSPGSVSKLLVTLATEGIVDRDEVGAVSAVRCRELIRRWVRDYSFAKSNPVVGSYIAPRGLDRAAARLNDLTGVALTGSAAARRLLPQSATAVVPMRLLACYAADPAGLAHELGLIGAEPRTANVMIAVPQDVSILPAVVAGPAPTALVLADLLTLPGRSDAEAEQLMDALTATDTRWEA